MEGRSCKREAESVYHERMTAKALWRETYRLVVTAFFAGPWEST